VLDESNTQGQGHARVPSRRQDKIREDMFNYPQTAYKGKTNYSDLTESAYLFWILVKNNHYMNWSQVLN
jgi:hypothetical protein